MANSITRRGVGILRVKNASYQLNPLLKDKMKAKFSTQLKSISNIGCFSDWIPLIIIFRQNHDIIIPK